MDGWMWRDRVPLTHAPGSDGWCVRDAICRLLGWPEESAEWQRYIEDPHPDDLLPLFKHLGLEVYDVSIPVHWNTLIGKLDHPGIATFDFPSVQMGHAVYVPHVYALLHHWPTPSGQPRTDLATWGWPLGAEHLQYPPTLLWVVVDSSQNPHVY